jgi:hypothetical protein
VSVASATIVCVAATTSCGSTTDVGQAGPSTPAISRVSVVLDPSSISVSPGSSTQSIGTIRGATRTALSSVIGVPNDVSVRVTSVATTDSVLTKKYIVFANTAAVPGRYVLTVRVTGSGESDVDAPLTLTVTAP